MRALNFDPPDWIPALKSGHVRMVQVSDNEAHALQYDGECGSELKEAVHSARHAARRGKECFVVLFIPPHSEV